jgi:putative lipoic acid-binding regulatory protein
MADSDGVDPLAFPATVPVKVLGEAGEDFEAFILEIVRRHFADLPDGAVTTRRSRGDRYLAVTVRVTASSREQLDALYTELSGNDRVKLAF